jgi:hypothetical protein
MGTSVDEVSGVGDFCVEGLPFWVNGGIVSL